ncbi:DUF3783 domain-containing protein [Agathobaculum sp.]|uniref:DUF3783 domain-containing protein n=1 Tax=Agathobaculum sp. TaxID=2048138 RepID=UPI002A839280|nr:DUF3783 domain-containing protein [Agathobaculum sp.]MDY3619019.1 DUF3783 domain-containing protein [Agathobaculum sp.]
MAVSRETVLYYDPVGGERAAKLKSILVRMGVRIKNVPADAVGQTVGCLLGRKGFGTRAEAEAPALAEPLLVLDGFTDKRLEILLREIKQQAVRVPYKAVVTETNLGWLLHQLYEELAAEHEAMNP